jgi:hypothetical protein
MPRTVRWGCQYAHAARDADGFQYLQRQPLNNRRDISNGLAAIYAIRRTSYVRCLDSPFEGSLAIWLINMGVAAPRQSEQAVWGRT